MHQVLNVLTFERIMTIMIIIKKTDKKKIDPPFNVRTWEGTNLTVCNSLRIEIITKLNVLLSTVLYISISVNPTLD